MNNNRTGAIAVGALLVAFGVLFLLQNFGLFGSIANLIWLFIFGAAGLTFLFVFATNRENWWAVIPGFTLLGLAVLIAFGDRLGAWGGAFFLGSIGLSFWVIYAVRREFWWALIPAGTLSTLAVVAALAEQTDGMVVGGILFLGMAATFALVYVLTGAGERQRWALIPAGILAAIGMLLILSLGGLVNYVWALALIGVGVYLLMRSKLLQR
ncbi:MAG: hypothetical protein MUC34_01645 [Anaerolineae bacterium]|jgi:hypothetical protein|nr:hypothetical protein [Anaerolineae bacterium]